MDAGRNFDTFVTSSSGTAMTDMVAYLNAIPAGRLVLVAVADEAGLTGSNANRCTPLSSLWVEQGKQTLEALGSTLIRQYCFRDSWAMVAVKGEGHARDEARGENVEASAQTTLTVP